MTDEAEIDWAVSFGNFLYNLSSYHQLCETNLLIFTVTHVHLFQIKKTEFALFNMITLHCLKVATAFAPSVVKASTGIVHRVTLIPGISLYFLSCLEAFSSLILFIFVAGKNFYTT